MTFLRIFFGRLLRRSSRFADAAHARLLHTDTLVATAVRAEGRDVGEALRTAHKAELTKARRALERVTKQRDTAQEQLSWLTALYDDVRAVDEIEPPFIDRDGALRVPNWTRVRDARRAVARYGAERALFADVQRGADLDNAIVATVRRLIAARHANTARSFTHAMQHDGVHPDAALVAFALIAFQDRLPTSAWEAFTRCDRSIALRLAPVEFFRAGFMVDPPTAEQVLAHTLDTPGASLPAVDWFEIARLAFGAGNEDLSRRALDEARRLAADTDNENLHEGIAWLSRWYGRRAAAEAGVMAPPKTIPFAVVDYKQPDEQLASRNLGDHVQTIASLGHVVRRSGLRFSGDEELVQVANRLRGRVRPDRVVSGDDAEIALYRIDRDATHYFPVPEGTWTIAFGWYMHPMFGLRYDVPLNPNLRPIFVSFHVNDLALLTADFLAYLRRYAPVGCRDWNTVALLTAAGVPAFFSGCLTTSIDTVFPAASDATPSGSLFVGAKADGPGEAFEQTFREVRRRPFAANIDDAVQRVQGYRDTYERVVTGKLHCYLPARSIGANVEFRPTNPADVRFDGLAFIDDHAFDAIRSGLLTKLDEVLRAITAGRSEDEVYALWRELCAPDVAAAAARTAALGDIAEPVLDVAGACSRIRAAAVTHERTQAAPDGDEVALEFSLDENYVRPLLVMLESVVARASCPVRAYVLCRGLGPTDLADISSLFPTVSFEWLPTTTVDYGDIGRLYPHLTVATMDRLLLPELLPGVDRLAHLDLDALCVGDVAELGRFQLGDARLAARTSPQPDFRSGFSGIINVAKSLRGDPDRARELIGRSHARHAFDFPGFNAGVMILNLARMRAENFCREFLPYTERFGMNDQEVLNAYAGSERAEIDPAWNRFPRLELVDDAKFIHWAGPQKPWSRDYIWGREIWQASAADLDRRRAALPKI